jgi:hypothetical protein
MTIHTLYIPGTTLTYDVRCNEASNEHPLSVIGSAMATGFATLSSHFGDRTVIIDDSGGSERSVLTNPDCPIAPGDNLHTRRRGQPRKPNAA